MLTFQAFHIGKTICKRNTPDWNYDKPYEWGLETLTETTFIKNL